MKYDIATIGGGPSGMMASGRAGELGAAVILIEKNKNLGVKLLATGGGRCNITNKSGNLKEMAAKFGKGGKFLFSAFNKFAPDDAISFFESRNVKTKIEDGNRVFPASDKARDVLNALIDYLKANNVEIRTNAEVKEIIMKGKGIEKIVLANSEEIFADKFVLAVGGKSYPATGSTGDGYFWLKKLGHKVIEPLPALTPIIVKEEFIKELEGVSLNNAGLSIYRNNRKIDFVKGEAIFTNNGMSGPAILNISKKIGQALAGGNIQIKIDFVPDLDFTALDYRLQKELNEGRSKIFKNSFYGLLPQKAVLLIAKLAGIDSEKKANLTTKEERKKILHLAKEFSLEIKALAGYERAMVTSGGVDLREVDPKTSRSKLIDNLFFAGEILGIDGPTGGYNLQVAWSTGRLVGEGAAK